ncbi:aspartyl/asparaginyl beta-hydroxylase domain-containing protein [Pelomonas sp. CA6]|uniref:aspartyl/asparaginyl beta-hydroxylase domain-containing protein n=1 Tax=Pelomonas sp. CA6 TaxID=2907999 RepID=UPI001F4BD0D6|nr:aspartyl/asparaginyl beta-hydroxylase domain-containing protein [Pelomonas sp. CA6]MCH7345864.1 aspartyl/asparaginyl beta-hydroxylase domain-containing protein [Pelomonas sp. CA6]
MRYWVLMVFVASALYAHFRGRVRFPIQRALFDFTVLIAPVNALMYLFSRAPATPYLKTDDFKEMELLRENWQLIREEALRLNDEGYIKAASGYNDIGFNSFFRTGWKRFYLKWYGVDMASAKALCPKTVELLQRIPSVKAAMFASLPPGARLVRHRDPYAGSLRYHLGLATPNAEGCFIEVDGERYHWRDGEAVMFDETYIHYAENSTDQQRVILFCDVERPLWFAPVRWLNRWFGKAVMTAAATQNLESEPIGGLNKFFFHFYQVRLKAKAFKARSRTGYYVLKWVLILGILGAIFI